MAAARNRERTAGGRAKIRAAVPGSRPAVRAIKIVKARVERTGEQGFAFLRLYRPPSLTSPYFPVETAERNLGGERRFVAYRQSREGGGGRKQEQSGSNKAHGAFIMSREVAESVNALVAAPLPANDRSTMTTPAFETLRPAQAAKGLILLCDHAANSLPEAYGTLGLESRNLSTHIAYDIGAAEVTRTLSALFEAPALLARWSRLLIDLNRGEDDPTLVMKLSDGSVIPGNRDADPAEIRRRIAAYHAPYHRAIEDEIARARGASDIPVLISIHSFTPAWKGKKRPWDVSVLWDRDARLAIPLMEKLTTAGFIVGDNEPYSGQLENDCLYRHGTQNGLPHALIEIRQDLIADESAARDFARRLYPILVDALAAMGPPSIQYTRPLGLGDRAMDEQTRTELEAAAFRRLVAHLRNRPEVQNIDLMIVGGFCRNCLGDWYRDAAAEKGIVLEKEAARAVVYGMAPSEWKIRYQKEATPEQLAAFAASQKTHS